VNRAIDRIIREEHITVILAAHRLSSIARAERVLVIEDGVISEEGRYDVLVGHLSPHASKPQPRCHEADEYNSEPKGGKSFPNAYGRAITTGKILCERYETSREGHGET
jgi:ABC-type glutathione transport system ATPase component